MILDILIWEDPRLRKKAEEVREITPEIQALIHNMVETVNVSSKSIGLAATQVGENVRIFVIRPYREQDGKALFDPPVVYVNPKLSSPSKIFDIQEEGCLSLPGLHLPVERPVSVTVEAMDETGTSFRKEVSGFEARQIMHENDHLNGILFFDRVPASFRKQVKQVLASFKKRTGKKK